MKRKVKLGIIAVVIAICAARICVPYTKRGEVTEETEVGFSKADFYREEPGRDRAVILFDSTKALEERIRLISHASERIVLSTLDFCEDNSGKRMLVAFYDAANRGVKVQILVDGYSYMIYVQRKASFQALDALDNVTIKAYNPINLLKPSKLMARPHSKYLLVDEAAYILGGRNTYDYFLGDETSYKNYDWDVLVCRDEQDENSPFYQVEKYFQSVWNPLDCKAAINTMSPWKNARNRVIEAGKALTVLYENMKSEKEDWFTAKDYTQMIVETDQICLLSNPIDASIKEPVLFYNMTELMWQPEGRIIFHTPYILCNDCMMGRLTALCAANPGVTMMTNFVANNGSPFGATDYLIHKLKILDTRIQILEYSQGVSCHGKCLTIDDRLTGVGSFNWDIRSAYIDTELMLATDNATLNVSMRNYMETYEHDALRTKDETTCHSKEGQIPQIISDKRKTRVRLLKPPDWLIRYLL